MDDDFLQSKSLLRHGNQYNMGYNEKVVSKIKFHRSWRKVSLHFIKISKVFTIINIQYSDNPEN